MLTRSTEYAIRAMVYIQLSNWEKKRPGVIEIAREVEAPQAFTAKILQTLSKHQLINSMKGRGGGFFYDDDSKQVYVYDVIRVMEGDAIFHKCAFGLKDCSSDAPCPLHGKFVAIRDAFLDIAKSETIQSLSTQISEGKAVLNTLTRPK